MYEKSELQYYSIHKKLNSALNGKKGNNTLSSILSLSAGTVSLILSLFTISIFGLLAAICSLGAGITALICKEDNKGMVIAEIAISSVSLIIYVNAFIINLL